MAGGDVALVRSIENFEDHPEYGARMLEEAGFTDGDLLVASTEGGETPYVIGAALHAPEISHKDHWYLFCNPESVLIEKLERCQQVIRNRKLNKLNLTVGPMAISGSTRMQASTVLMLAAGTALFECLKDHPTFDSIEESINSLLDHMGEIDTQPLAAFIVEESECYRRGDSLLYTTKDYGITVITDTTERSPTFSLAPFENRQDTGAASSLCYLCLPSTHSADGAWKLLLQRDPRPLVGWQDYESIGGPQRLAGYDFSSSLPEWRQKVRPQVTQRYFDISRSSEGLCFKFESIEATFPAHGLSLLNEHLTLKMLLNMHSTLVMGRLQRYHGNVMTCVRPSNFKLIDRTIRYVQLLLKREGINNYTYEDICLQCFTELEGAAINEPIVLKVLEVLKSKARALRDSGNTSSVFQSKGQYESRPFSAR
jgi:N-acetylmuramic acid 6-phosphate etherase